MKIQPIESIVVGGNTVCLSFRNKLVLKLNAFHNRNTRRTHAAQHIRRAKMSTNNLCLSRRHLLFRLWCL